MRQPLKVCLVLGVLAVLLLAGVSPLPAAADDSMAFGLSSLLTPSALDTLLPPSSAPSWWWGAWPWGWWGGWWPWPWWGGWWWPWFWPWWPWWFY